MSKPAHNVLSPCSGGQRTGSEMRDPPIATRIGAWNSWRTPHRTRRWRILPRPGSLCRPLPDSSGGPSTLRTWDRRYGLGPGHTEGRHRRYAGEDVERLTRMQELVRNGVATADAARAAQSAAIDPRTRSSDPAPSSRPPQRRPRRRVGSLHGSRRPPGAWLGQGGGSPRRTACVRLIREVLRHGGVVGLGIRSFGLC